MDWFEQLTGFRETDYLQTKSLLTVNDGSLHSKVDRETYKVGNLSLPSLEELRDATSGEREVGPLNVRIVQGDIRELHRKAENCGALFQVASQFNLLEMIGPDVTPEDGVTRYEWDPTQGPACAIAAGAATIYRNYLVPLGDQLGQTQQRQIDVLADLGEALAAKIGAEPQSLWRMKNGYALPTEGSLSRVNEWLEKARADEIHELRSKLRIGLHVDVEVTDRPDKQGQLVSQAFCSAMPVSYSGLAARLWAPLGKLILEAAYEATLHAAVLNAKRRASNRVLLTRLGGGAFGNPDHWIDDAIRNALCIFAGAGLDVVFVCRSSPPKDLIRLAGEFS